MWQKEEPIDWDRLCSNDAKVQKNTQDLFDIEATKFIKSTDFTANKAIWHFQQVLLDSNDTAAFESRYCKEKFQFDVAIVDVIMDSPTAIKYIQNKRVTLTDKLANFGKYCLN